MPERYDITKDELTKKAAYIESITRPPVAESPPAQEPDPAKMAYDPAWQREHDPEYLRKVALLRGLKP